MVCRSVVGKVVGVDNRGVEFRIVLLESFGHLFHDKGDIVGFVVGRNSHHQVDRSVLEIITNQKVFAHQSIC